MRWVWRKVLISRAKFKKESLSLKPSLVCTKVDSQYIERLLKADLSTQLQLFEHITANN